MKESKADIILHPVRMRIIQTLINKRNLTVQQIGEKLADIPQASLYRHLKKLSDAGIIEVVEENKVRGTVEKVYGLPEQGASLSEEELKNAGPEEHMGFFMKFMATVMDDFERYVNQEDFNFVKDGTGYSQASFYASDEEYLEFVTTINSSLMKLISNGEEGRRKRTLTTIVTAEKKDEHPE
ncbi:helix-turn-helix domain-containing protein [Planococcus shixiaomingii]|uniref:helix-turn-helix domain-containing protein n=1 Tax=Planococcus shixiaomingii TaxID=3058393 RepID=UPI00262E6C95|nr:helix-turn-helix domain-containing protein [Planococcus sp. N022]WKA54578.1 helix-turn-helix domain-containing protein [Planococcus sp. N022]